MPVQFYLRSDIIAAMRTITSLLDVCAGIGGISAAAARVGIKCFAATDCDPKCQLTYRENWPTTQYLLADLRKQTDEMISWWHDAKIPLLTAGFPCQAFSRAGRRRGIEDINAGGDLFAYLCRLIRGLQPEVLLLENVAHLQRHRGGRTWAGMLEELAQCGYKINFAILNARDICGLPQNRERLYVVGWREQTLAEQFSFPGACENKIPLKAFFETEVDDRYYVKDGKITDAVARVGAKMDAIYTWRRYYLRETTTGICPTLMASMGTGGHNVPMIVDARGLRRLTPRECLRLQGFSEDFRLPAELSQWDAYAQIGNSVSVPTAAAILHEILRTVS